MGEWRKRRYGKGEDGGRGEGEMVGEWGKGDDGGIEG